jgi:predicted O-methyltransferase YrrM
MTEGTTTSTPNLELTTYEDIVDYILACLQRTGTLASDVVPSPWDAFLRLSDLVHGTFDVPATTLTPIMRRLLFALGLAVRPRNVVGVGTYVGYTFSWLLRDRSDDETAPFVQIAMGIDIDAQANALARRNCATLGHGEHLTFMDADGVVAVAQFQHPIDLLYLDLDAPHEGKAAYRHVLRAASSRLRSGAFVLAHDPCVAAFEEDFKAYDRYIRDSGLFSDAWVFPVDACGLSVAVVR